VPNARASVMPPGSPCANRRRGSRWQSRAGITTRRFRRYVEAKQARQRLADHGLAAGQSMSGRIGVDRVEDRLFIGCKHGPHGDPFRTMSCNRPGPGSELRALGFDQLADFRMASPFLLGSAMLDSAPGAAFFVSHRQQSSISYAVTG